MKKPTNKGQQFISQVEQSLENTTRPLGMPPLEAIQSEVLRIGYTKADAQDIYDFWLSNGFRTGVNRIRDWRAAIRVMVRHNRLPSQRAEPPGLIEHKQEKPAQLREAYLDRQKNRETEATEEERLRAGHALRQWRKQQGR